MVADRTTNHCGRGVGAAYPTLGRPERPHQDHSSRACCRWARRLDVSSRSSGSQGAARHEGVLCYARDPSLISPHRCRPQVGQHTGRPLHRVPERRAHSPHTDSVCGRQGTGTDRSSRGTLPVESDTLRGEEGALNHKRRGDCGSSCHGRRLWPIPLVAQQECNISEPNQQNQRPTPPAPKSQGALQFHHSPPPRLCDAFRVIADHRPNSLQDKPYFPPSLCTGLVAAPP